MTKASGLAVGEPSWAAVPGAGRSSATARPRRSRGSTSMRRMGESPLASGAPHRFGQECWAPL